MIGGKKKKSERRKVDDRERGIEKEKKKRE